MDDEVQNTLPRRIQQALPALLGAAIIVLIAVIIAKPWEKSASGDGLGIITQVQPENPDLDSIGTLAYPEKLAPNFRLETLDGTPIELAELRGTPVFVNFWATWCFSCVSEMPAIQRIADEYGDQLTIVGVNTGEEAITAETFATSNDITYPLVLDPSQDVTRAYDVRAMPTSLFIDTDGVVQSVRYGAITTAEMRELIEPLFAESSTQSANLNEG